jgi:hypothetical protein
MDENREAILSHIEAARNPNESMQLAQRIRRHCWPVSHADRTTPAALDWLRRWGPHGIKPATPDCSCAHGRCAVCN